MLLPVPVNKQLLHCFNNSEVQVKANTLAGQQRACDVQIKQHCVLCSVHRNAATNEVEVSSAVYKITAISSGVAIGHVYCHQSCVHVDAYYMYIVYLHLASESTHYDIDCFLLLFCH